MAPPPGQDPHRFVYSRAPIWLTHLKSINDSVERRKGNDPDAFGTPELSFQTNTVDTSGLDTIGTPPPLQTILPSSINKRLSRVDNRSTNATKSFLSSPEAYKELRRQRSQVILTVIYDAESQDMLAEIVKEVDKAVYMNTKTNARPLPGDHAARLQKASRLCEDAAFQLLRDGQCQPYSTAAAKIFHEVFMASWKEVMHDQLAQNAALGNKSSAPAPSSPGQRARIPEVQLADLNAEVDDDDDDDDDDLPLPPLRLTSRIGAPR